jgi:hypothetical protein
MKRCWMIILLVSLALAACSPQQGGKCDQGLCVEVRAADTQGLDGSVVITIKVTSDTDRDALSVSVNASPGTIFDEPETSDSESSKGEAMVSWLVDVKANQPYVLMRTAHLPGKDGIVFFIANAASQTGLMISDGIRIQLIGGTLVPHLGSQNIQINAADGEATRAIPIVPFATFDKTPLSPPTLTPILAPTETPAPTDTPSPAYPPPAEATPTFQGDSASSSPDTGGTAYPAP